MENKISIDELFREKLHEGKEKPNLGAWANMERLLDGKEPYKTIPPISTIQKNTLWFVLGGILLLTSTVVGSYLTYQKYTASKASTPKLHAVVANQNKLATVIKTPSTFATTNNCAKDTWKASNNVNSKAEFASTQNPKPISTNKHTFSPTTSQANNTPIKATSKKQNITANINTQISKNNNRTAKQEEEKNTLLASANGIKTKAQKNIVPAKNTEKIKPIISITKDTVDIIEIQEKYVTNENGIKEKINDTAKVGIKVIEKPIVNNEAIVRAEDQRAHPEKYNPRYVNVESTYIQKVETPTVLSASLHKENLSEHTSELTNTTLKSASRSTNTSSAKHLSMMGQMKQFYSNMQEKLNSISFKLFNTNLNVYPGMSVGVNASVLSTKHDFGGFHAGLNAMTPISAAFNFLAELKFFYKNNSGYTINDSHTKYISQSTSSPDTAHKTYAYQLDSTVTAYNFQRFTSLELPLIIQTNIRSFTLYGGLQFAYNFKMKVKEKTKNYTVDSVVTLPNSTPHFFPYETASLYTQNDFKSRFGIGYLVGASYNFNTNLYLDIRLAQNLWDNARTSTATEISKTFFRVPSLQFSLGYRFRSYTPNGR